MLKKLKQKISRHKRIRAKVKGTAACPRLCVFRSNQHIYAQLIDDDKGKILAQANDLQSKAKTKLEKANDVGKVIAEKAVGLKMAKVIFDRGGFKYHGRVKAVAQAARTAGLKF